MTLHNTTQDLPAASGTWQNIAREIGIADSASTPDPIAKTATNVPDNSTATRQFWSRSRSVQWLLPLAASFLFAFGLGLYPLLKNPVPNADYVAVLTAPNGAAKLTALTATDGQIMWLQWQEVTIATHSSIQLWAVSKRDGQVRSVAIFDSTSMNSLKLDPAALRLVKDADKLLLTQEEAGGSAIDEPSANLIASGVCVRLLMTTEKKG